MRGGADLLILNESRLFGGAAVNSEVRRIVGIVTCQHIPSKRVFTPGFGQGIRKEGCLMTEFIFNETLWDNVRAEGREGMARKLQIAREKIEKIFGRGANKECRIPFTALATEVHYEAREAEWKPYVAAVARAMSIEVDEDLCVVNYEFPSATEAMDSLIIALVGLSTGCDIEMPCTCDGRTASLPIARA